MKCIQKWGLSPAEPCGPDIRVRPPGQECPGHQLLCAQRRYQFFHQLGACLIAATLVPGVTAQQPRFFKGIDAGNLKQEEILAPLLDSDVYAGTSDGLADLRVLDDKGNEVPFLLQKVTEPRTVSVRQTAPAGDVSLRELKEGGLEIQVSKDEKLPPAEGISLVTPLRNYQQQVQVSGSSDGRSWQTLVADALIFDYSRYMDVGNHEIGLPQNRYSHFRLTIRDVTSNQESELLELTRRLQGGKETERVERTAVERRPFRIDRIDFWYHERRQGDKKTDYPVADFKAEASAESRQTFIHVHTRREPLTGFHLETSSRNFSRRVAVQVPLAQGMRTQWHDIGTGTISRMDFRDLHRDELLVSFPEARHEEYRIVIDNGDNPALAVTGVRGEGNAYQALFLAAPGVAYHLSYGSEAAKAPSYDTATLRESLARGYQPVAVRLSSQTTQSAAGAPTGIVMRRVLNNPFVLGGVILVLVAVLVWGLYRAGRRIDRLPKEPGS
jgi:hypothetical protein